MKLWQLKKLSTNESLNEPQPLPENWGPIFGMKNITEKLGNLSWLGDNYVDQGWQIVGESTDVLEPKVSTLEEIEWERAKNKLRESDWSMMSDVPMTAGEKILWIEYRKSLREIRLQPGFPNDIVWPTRP